MKTPPPWSSAASKATRWENPPGVGEEHAASMATSGESDPEVGEFPGGSEEDVAYMAISGEPGPEVGEPPAAARKTPRTGQSAASQTRGWASPPPYPPFPAAARKLPSPWPSAASWRCGRPFSGNSVRPLVL
jgi:hypothetical protein